MSPEKLLAVQQAVTRADDALISAARRGSLKMCIPVRSDDTDVLVAHVLREIVPALLAEIKKLEEPRHVCEFCDKELVYEDAAVCLVCYNANMATRPLPSVKS